MARVFILKEPQQKPALIANPKIEANPHFGLFRGKYYHSNVKSDMPQKLDVKWEELLMCDGATERQAAVVRDGEAEIVESAGSSEGNASLET